MPPGVRLLLALVVSLAAAGAGAYALLSYELRQDLVDEYAQIQRADARGFEGIAASRPRPTAIREIGDLLAALARRKGTDEALLIGPGGAVSAAADPEAVGETDRDPNTIRALESGTAYAGLEADPGEDGGNFEFVTPLRLDGERYALEVSFASDTLNAQLVDVRRVLLLVVIAASIVIAVLFYLLGGRVLLRNHRLALERATRDGLTDLPNHRAFQDELEQVTALARRNEDPLALAVLDLDHFKLVNDRHGHPAGDALLRRTATILRDGRSADRAYRIGGDEFAMLLPQTDEDGARMLIRRLSRELSEAEISVSIGVAAAPPGRVADDLRGEADAALYEAKESGADWALFADIRGIGPVITPAKRDGVRRLVESGEIDTVFQPIWDFGSHDLLGIEALSRPDPSYGLSGPAEAFDIAEKIGCVHELDELCATRALERGAALPQGARLFVNLAPKTLELDAGADGWLLAAVERSGLDPGRVVIEVTERIAGRTEPVAAQLRELRQAGFLLALDDVGTGNAGLEMLRRIGADYVKLDHGIVGSAATDPNARAVLMAMATFARQTGAYVIAEGIEDQETLDFLRSIEALELRPGTIVQGGQGFELGGPSPELPGRGEHKLEASASRGD